MYICSINKITNILKAASIYKDLEFDENKPKLTVLLDTSFTKELRIAMFKGTQMREHQTPYPIVVEIIEGDISFGVNKEVLKLTKGDLIALDGGVPHDLVAFKNTIIRLTITKNDKIERVEKVLVTS